MVKEKELSKVYTFMDYTADYLVFDVSDLDDVKRTFLNIDGNNDELLDAFLSYLPSLKEQITTDVEFFYNSDPAATNLDVIRKAYPGYQAIVSYRISHVLNSLGLTLVARLISEKAHSLTGIDIHPGATIGCPFFIDHGTGIVIGETAIVGKNVKIYQGVTLGALSLSRGQELKGTKRHPTVGDDVTIYAGASILGDITVGNNVTIGGNVFITDDIPNDTKVVLAKPSLIMMKK